MAGLKGRSLVFFLVWTNLTHVTMNTELEQWGTGMLQFWFRWKEKGKEQITCKNKRLKATERRCWCWYWCCSRSQYTAENLPALGRSIKPFSITWNFWSRVSPQKEKSHAQFPPKPNYSLKPLLSSWHFTVPRFKEKAIVCLVAHVQGFPEAHHNDILSISWSNMTF